MTYHNPKQSWLRSTGQSGRRIIVVGILLQTKSQGDFAENGFIRLNQLFEDEFDGRIIKEAVVEAVLVEVQDNALEQKKWRDDVK